MLSNGAAEINRENGRNNENPVNDEFNVVLTVTKIAIVAIFMLPLVEYSMRTKSNLNQTEIDQIEKTKTIQTNVLDSTATEHIDKIQVVDAKSSTKIIEPTCPSSYKLIILKEIWKELVENNTSCTPEDFTNINKHKIPKRLVKNRLRQDAQVSVVVNYAVGLILLTSLGAALIELYKAKQNPEKKDGKNSLSRKCSLADLTVMKHQRKEIMRRDSIMEIPEENLYSKQLGQKPTSLQRQYSFPIGPNSYSPKGSPILGRKLSMQATRFIPVVDGRPATVLEGRRHSIVTDGRQPLILETRRVSIDGKGSYLDRNLLEDSPDKKYYVRSRRVHRH